MKKFLLHTFLFSLLPVAGIVILFIIPVDRKYTYEFISKGGCQGRPPWIYQRIYEDNTPIDVAFIGTSHTMSGVNDEWIENILRDSTGKNIHCRNLSFCGFGRDFDFLLIRDLLEHKKPKAIVLEVREEEAQLGHLYFGYMANTGDLLGAPKAYNRSYLPAMYKALLFRLQYVRELLTHENLSRQTEISSSVFGHGSIGYTADANELDGAMGRARIRQQKKIIALENVFNTFPLEYIKEITGLAKANGAQLYFLYLPAYSGQTPVEEIEKRYAGFGELIMPDKSTFSDKTNWADKEHLNYKGAAAVSAKVAGALKSI